MTDATPGQIKPNGWDDPNFRGYGACVEYRGFTINKLRGTSLPWHYSEGDKHRPLGTPYIGAAISLKYAKRGIDQLLKQRACEKQDV